MKKLFKHNDFSIVFLRLFLIIFSASIFVGCGKKLRNEKLIVKIVSDKDIQGDKQDLVTSVIQSLANYQISVNHKDTILLPVLSVHRFDLNETKDIDVPLSGPNKLRNSIGLLSTKQIIENYDKEVPKLAFPELLKTKATKITKPEDVFIKFPNAIALNIGLSKIEIDSFKSAIYDSLFAIKLNTVVVFYLTDGNANKAIPPIPAGIYQNRDTCDLAAHISYQVVSDGNGGFKFGNKIKDNSVECGYSPPKDISKEKEKAEFKEKTTTKRKRNTSPPYTPIKKVEIDPTKDTSKMIKIKKSDIKN